MADARRTQSEPVQQGDAFLRQFGFKIEARPKDGAPVWRKEKVVVTEPRAYQLALRELEVKENLKNYEEGS